MTNKVYFGKTKGRYNLCSKEEEWQVYIYVDRLSLSECFDFDPDISHMCPTDIINMISEKLESYWISTDREQKREKIKELLSKSNEINRVWAEKEIGYLAEQIEKLKDLYLAEDKND